LHVLAEFRKKGMIANEEIMKGIYNPVPDSDR
jgi:hypothetical protein